MLKPKVVFYKLFLKPSVDGKIGFTGEHPSFFLFRLFQVLFKVANVVAQCPNGDLNLPD